jgi:uncharacterized protein YuzE
MRAEIHKVTHDEAANAAYIYLTEIEKGDAVKSVQVPDSPLVLDFDRDGTLIGIESLNPDALPPKLLEQAIEP